VQPGSAERRDQNTDDAAGAQPDQPMPREHPLAGALLGG
jgi:hypothetical protein